MTPPPDYCENDPGRGSCGHPGPIPLRFSLGREPWAWRNRLLSARASSRRPRTYLIYGENWGRSYWLGLLHAR